MKKKLQMLLVALLRDNLLYVQLNMQWCKNVAALARIAGPDRLSEQVMTAIWPPTGSFSSGWAKTGKHAGVDHRSNNLYPAILLRNYNFPII